MSTNSLNSSLLGTSSREDSNSSQAGSGGSKVRASKGQRSGISGRAASSSDGPAGSDSVVDEEAVLKTVRLSQRCSAEAIGMKFSGLYLFLICYSLECLLVAIEKSSSKELVDLLNELCQSNDDISVSQLLLGGGHSQSPIISQQLPSQTSRPDVPCPFQPEVPRPLQSDLVPLSGRQSTQNYQAPPPSSQSFCETSSQSLGVRLLDKICRRSVSVRSGSLFSTPSPSPPPTHRHSRGGEVGGVCLHMDPRAGVGKWLA